jgi:hypothetical protein
MAARGRARRCYHSTLLSFGICINDLPNLSSSFCHVPNGVFHHKFLTVLLTVVKVNQALGCGWLATSDIKKQSARA